MTLKDQNKHYEIIKPILESEEFQKRRLYNHHDNISVYDHCLAVSKLSYHLAKKLKKDYKTAAIAGLLHDFYYNPWQEIKEKKKILESHGFTHAKEAMINAYSCYPELMDEKIEDAISKHMFPLNVTPPKYIESWIVTIADKCISCEVFKNPKFLPKLVGIKGKEKR